MKLLDILFSANAAQPERVAAPVFDTAGAAQPAYRPVLLPSFAAGAWFETAYVACCGDPGDCNEACQ